MFSLSPSEVGPITSGQRQSMPSVAGTAWRHISWPEIVLLFSERHTFRQLSFWKYMTSYNFSLPHSDSRFDRLPFNDKWCPSLTGTARRHTSWPEIIFLLSGRLLSFVKFHIEKHKKTRFFTAAQWQSVRSASCQRQSMPVSSKHNLTPYIPTVHSIPS